MSAVAEDEWEGLLFCGKRFFNNNNKKVLEAVANFTLELTCYVNACSWLRKVWRNKI